jgi:hypothetical protein
LIEQIGGHYRTNISNQFLRPLLLQLQIDKNTWDQIESLTEKTEMFHYQGFHLDDLYRQIAACARFVEIARSGLIPSLRVKLTTNPNSPDRILRDMAASNFASNLKVFADLLNELFMVLMDIDKEHAGKSTKPFFEQLPELTSINRLLNGS